MGPWAPLLNARGEGPRDAPTTSRFATGRPHPCPVVGARSTNRCPNNKQIGNIRANFGSKRGPLPSRNAYRTSTISNFVPRFGEKEARCFAGMTIKQALFPTCCPDSVPSRRTIRGTFGTPLGARPRAGPKVHVVVRDVLLDDVSYDSVYSARSGGSAGRGAKQVKRARGEGARSGRKNASSITFTTTRWWW